MVRAFWLAFRIAFQRVRRTGEFNRRVIGEVVADVGGQLKGGERWAGRSQSW
jgi:hypothetical protein